MDRWNSSVKYDEKRLLLIRTGDQSSVFSSYRINEIDWNQYSQFDRIFIFEDFMREIVSCKWSRYPLVKGINDEVLKNDPAQYGKQIIANVSNQLELKYGKNFAEKNPRRMMQFSIEFSDFEIVVPWHDN